jgi:muramoyltetrapeptide carboxypeptidase
MSSELKKLRRVVTDGDDAPLVSVIAPASYATPQNFENGLEGLREFGLEPKVCTHARARGPLFFAGTREDRLKDLHAAFADEETEAIFAVRGGYGSNYLLDGLDLERIARNPKPFFCYSDLTGIQLRLLDKLGLPAFHGPMAAADFAVRDGVHEASLMAALKGETYSVGAGEGLRTLKSGSAEGVLYGGCLSILVAMLGTPFEPETEGKLLFLEDVGAKPYQIDRMLWQLRTAGKFEGVCGVIFGEMLNCVAAGESLERVGSGVGGQLEEVILRFFEGVEVPIAMGLRSGHVTRENVTLTFGVKARLKTNEASAELEILESAVS